MPDNESAVSPSDSNSESKSDSGSDLEMERNTQLVECGDCGRQFPKDTHRCPDDGTKLSRPDKDPLVGNLFSGRYEILQRVGKGGMGVVYKARQKYMENVVAIKVLFKEYASDQQAVDRFQLEAKTLSTLDHPNIVRVLDFDITPDKQPFLAMEFLHGKTLEYYIAKNGGPMPIEQALSLFLLATDALAHAHAKGVIHRDLKPSNMVLLDEKGAQPSIKIVDFGIAKIKPQEGLEGQNLTKSGEIFGSPLYMSPEQCKGKPLDERSDIYSLGVLMYETLTGIPPIMGLNSFETMTKHVNEIPISMRRVIPHANISESIDAAILSTLRKKPSRRPSSASELKSLLIECAKESGIKFKHDIDWDDYSPLSSSRYAAFRSAEDCSGSESNSASGAGSAGEITATEQGSNAQKSAAEVTRRDDASAHALKLRQSTIMLGSLLILTLTAIGAYLTLPGPAQDPATNWQRIAWHSAMDDGERQASVYKRAFDAEDKERAYNWSVASFKKAIDLGVGMGDLSDKRQQSERALLHLYESHHDDKLAASLREDILRHHQERMVAVYGQDIASEMKEGDAALIGPRSDFDLNSIRVEKLLQYSQFMIERARESLAKKEYNGALNFLSDAVALEEKSHGVNGDKTTQCATEFCQTLIDAHVESSKIDRAQRLKRRAESAITQE